MMGKPANMAQKSENELKESKKIVQSHKSSNKQLKRDKLLKTQDHNLISKATVGSVQKYDRNLDLLKAATINPSDSQAALQKHLSKRGANLSVQSNTTKEDSMGNKRVSKHASYAGSSSKKDKSTFAAQMDKDYMSQLNSIVQMAVPTSFPQLGQNQDLNLNFTTK